MMDIKKKLMELLSPTSLNFEEAAYLADYLVKNGVTIQEWVSVDDRLPKRFESVLVFRDGKISIDYNEGNGWFAYDFNGKRVTHWMPLPLAPTASEIKKL